MPTEVFLKLIIGIFFFFFWMRVFMSVNTSDELTRKHIFLSHKLNDYFQNHSGKENNLYRNISVVRYEIGYK